MFSTQFGEITIQLWELLALPFYLLLIFLIATTHSRKRIAKNPLYKYYVWGLFAKIIGGISFVLVYMFYWYGADTTSYFESAMAMKNLLFISPNDWFLSEFLGNTREHFSLFTISTGYALPFMYFDPKTFMVIRLINPLLIFSFSSYLITTILLNCLLYAGFWKLFIVFSDHYPNRSKLFAFAILFFPSVLFWGSGILKDSITLSCTGWVIFCIHRIFILKKNKGRFYLPLIISLFLIVSIKPYIFFALLPGSIMWIFSGRIATMKNTAVKFLIIPVILFLSIGGGSYILSLLESSMGKYALSNIATTLVVTQNDLKQSYYHGHSFDIGLTDASSTGLIKKLPAALMAGLYRPFIWESGNAVMFISGLENMLILILTITSIFQMNLVSFGKKIFQEPMLFFALSFSVFFAYSVGISTSNFGALVRFKIAYLPFFLCSLFILVKRKDERMELKKRQKKQISNSI